MRELVLGRSVPWKRSVTLPRNLRQRHGYVIGRTGKGKSNLLHRLIAQDALGGYAVAVFDAGDLGPHVYESLPEKAMRRVRWLSPSAPIPYNPLLRRRDDPARLEHELVALIDQLNAELSENTTPLSPRMKRLFSAALEQVLGTPEPTLASIVLVLRGKKEFLRRSLELGAEEFELTWEAVLDRLSFLRDRRIRRILCARHELDLGQVIDESQILLVSLAGLEKPLVRFIGTMLFHGLQATLFEREEADRHPLALYADELQDFVATPYAIATFQTLCAQGRRYALAFTGAHQDFGTIPKALLSTLHGNPGCQIAFSCGPDEAAKMAAIFGDQWPSERIAFLPDHHAIARIDESVVQLTTLPPLGKLRRLTNSPTREESDPPDPFKAIVHEHHERREPHRPFRKPRGAAPTPLAA